MSHKIGKTVTYYPRGRSGLPTAGQIIRIYGIKPVACLIYYCQDSRQIREVANVPYGVSEGPFFVYPDDEI